MQLVTLLCLYAREWCGRTYIFFYESFYKDSIMKILLWIFGTVSMYLFFIQKYLIKKFLREKILKYSNHCNLLHGISQRTN